MRRGGVPQPASSSSSSLRAARGGGSPKPAASQSPPSARVDEDEDEYTSDAMSVSPAATPVPERVRPTEDVAKRRRGAPVRVPAPGSSGQRSKDSHRRPPMTPVALMSYERSGRLGVSGEASPTPSPEGSPPAARRAFLPGTSPLVTQRLPGLELTPDGADVLSSTTPSLPSPSAGALDEIISVQRLQVAGPKAGHLTYTGGVLRESLLPQGLGTLHDSIKRKTFHGDFENGLKHGYGKTKYHELPAPQYHEGSYQHGLRHGPGCFAFANGDVYVGNFKRGEFHGLGRMTFARDGSKFDGQWSRGRMVFGTKWSAPDSRGDCDKYVGSFDEHGRASGYGTTFHKNGDVHRGYYKNDQRHGRGQVVAAGKTMTSTLTFAYGKPAPNTSLVIDLMDPHSATMLATGVRFSGRVLKGERVIGKLETIHAKSARSQRNVLGAPPRSPNEVRLYDDDEEESEILRYRPRELEAFEPSAEPKSFLVRHGLFEFASPRLIHQFPPSLLLGTIGFIVVYEGGEQHHESFAFEYRCSTSNLREDLLSTVLPHKVSREPIQCWSESLYRLEGGAARWIRPFTGDVWFATYEAFSSSQHQQMMDSQAVDLLLFVSETTSPWRAFKINPVGNVLEEVAVAPLEGDESASV